MYQNPILCVPHIIHTLKRFGSFSGYKLNLGKSECYPVNDLALQMQDNILPFQMSRSGFKYLGINIARDMQSLYQENFVRIFDKNWT